MLIPDVLTFLRTTMNLLVFNQNLQNTTLCQQCKGSCCKTCPGISIPTDWGAPDIILFTTNITNALKTGRYTVDWWEGDPRTSLGPLYKAVKILSKEEILQAKTNPLPQVYYVRPAIVGYENKVRHPGWGGRCTFLTDNGCSLEHNSRPAECRFLEPSENFPNCHLHFSKVETVIQWINFQNELVKIIESLET